MNCMTCNDEGWLGGASCQRFIECPDCQPTRPTKKPKNKALERVAEKLRRAGATLPAPAVTGTIEGSIVTGLCIALAIVEGEMGEPA